MDLDHTYIMTKKKCPDCNNTGYIPIESGQRRCPCRGEGIEELMPFKGLLNIVRDNIKQHLQEQQYQKKVRNLDFEPPK
jgi:RecJ-like exonuclease